MSRGLRQRIERLEDDRGGPDIPHVIVATCPIPDNDKLPTTATIQQWLDREVAHIAFKGHAVLYDGGCRHPLTIEEWQARYCLRGT